MGLITSGGSGSILHSVLAYREWARNVKGIAHPNIIKPETAHPAFNKACHLVDVELRQAPIDPATAQVDVGALAALIDENTAAIIGSACNYGYGTIDPIEEMGRLALDSGIGLHVDGCLGGFILPWGEQLGYDIPPFDFRVPGVTSISADTHKYAYGLKGTSVLLFRDKVLRNGQYFYLTDWTGGKYCSPGIDGSRSGGLLAATWAGMVSLGREGYLRYARAIFETAFAMQDAVKAHSELRLIGSPTFCFSFTSDEFDIYHVNDFMRTRGLALQRPAVPELDPHGGDAAADPGRPRRHVRDRPRRGGPLRRRAQGRAGEEQRDLRRRRRRAVGRRRRVHRGRDGRDDGRAAGAPAGPPDRRSRDPEAQGTRSIQTRGRRRRGVQFQRRITR